MVIGDFHCKGLFTSGFGQVIQVGEFLLACTAYCEKEGQKDYGVYVFHRSGFKTKDKSHKTKVLIKDKRQKSQEKSKNHTHK